MPVTGLAENHMREVVENLECALKNYLATQMLIEMEAEEQIGAEKHERSNHRIG